MRPPAAVVASALIITTQASGQDRLQALLAKVGDYVNAYERRFSLLVAEEHYVQAVEEPPVVHTSAPALARDGSGSAFAKGEGKRRQRTLRSDYLLVALPGGGWLPFRDVYEVDGRPVRDRSDRLTRLFLTDAGSARVDAGAAFEQARRIMAESARFNVGDVQRNINLPTLALLFAAAENQPRFNYRLQRPDAGGGDILRYMEQQRPTLIRTTNGRDLPARGRIWLDADGAITQTELVATDAQVSATITVNYERSEPLDMHVPARMNETYELRGRAGTVSGDATYSRFRRFHVSTTEKIGH